jgi:hypothetical protein
LLDQRLSTIPQHSWVSKLFGFQFVVRQNAAADALSRRGEDPSMVHAVSIPDFELLDQFRREAESLLETIAKKEEIVAGSTGPEWALIDNLVVCRDCLFLPSSATTWPQVQVYVHGMGNEGIQKTLQRLRASFIPDDNNLVRNHIRSCPVCHRNKTEQLHPAGLLQPLAKPSSVWRDIALDFVEGFPKVGGKSVILTVVDRFSKYAHFVALVHHRRQGVLQLHRSSSPARHGRSFSAALNSALAWLFTHRQTANLRSQTRPSLSIFVAWRATDQGFGCSGSPGPKFATTHPIRQPCTPRCLKSSTAKLRRPYFHSWPARRGSQHWSSSCVIATPSWRK